jgi:hypothetical protein
MQTNYYTNDMISMYPIDKSYDLIIEDNNNYKSINEDIFPLSENQTNKILYDITQVKIKKPEINDNLLPKVPVKITAPSYDIPMSVGSYMPFNDVNIDIIPNGISVGTTAQNSQPNNKLSDTAKKYSLTLEKFNNTNDNTLSTNICYIIIVIFIILIFKILTNIKI